MPVAGVAAEASCRERDPVKAKAPPQAGRLASKWWIRERDGGCQLSCGLLAWLSLGEGVRALMSVSPPVRGAVGSVASCELPGCGGVGLGRLFLISFLSRLIVQNREKPSHSPVPRVSSVLRRLEYIGHTRTTPTTAIRQMARHVSGLALSPDNEPSPYSAPIDADSFAGPASPMVSFHARNLT